MSRKYYAFTALVVFASCALYAWHMDRSGFITDDGGITLRYADRLARGLGYGYNDGEAVNGSSNPLYTLLLAGMLALGLEPEGAIVAIAVPAFAATCTLLAFTFARYYSAAAGVLALGAFLAADRVYSGLFDAMEPTLSVLLAALLFHALHTRSRIYQGIVLGLLVANKLDGAIAALAFAATYVVVRRSFPVRVTAVALLAAAPVFVVLFLSFGSILPQSMLQKLEMETVGGFNRNWMNDTLLWRVPLFYGPALLSLLLPRRGEESLPRYVIQLWLVGYVGTYSLVDLGARHPWYCTLPAFLIVLLAATMAASLLGSRGALTGISTRFAKIGLRGRTSILLQGLVGLLILFAFVQPKVNARLRRQQPRPLHPTLAGEIARQAAGVWLRRHTSGTEGLRTFCGLAAFEYGGPVYDSAGLSSRLDEPPGFPIAYEIPSSYRHGQRVPSTLGGRQLVAVFQYASRALRYAVFASPDSEIVTKGVSHFTSDLANLVPVKDVPNNTALNPEAHILADGSIGVRVPSRLVYDMESVGPPVVTFTPGLRNRLGPVVSGARISIRINGEEVYAASLEPGAPHDRGQSRPPRNDAAGRYRIELIAEPLSSDVSSWVLWEHILVRLGEPLRSEDFRATCEPWAQRIDYVAFFGLP